MKPTLDSFQKSFPEVPSVPRWAQLIPSHSEGDSIFAAASGLSLLTTFLRASPAYLGALCERLALKAATAANRAAKRPEDEDTIRDHWWLRHADEDLTPAAQLFEAYRRVSRSRGGLAAWTPEHLSHFASLFGRPLTQPAGTSLAAVIERSRAAANPVHAAANAASAMFTHEPDIEGLSHLVADAVLADRLGWDRPLPLLASFVATPTLRAGGNKRRAVPSDPNWPSTVFGAYALSVPFVLQIATTLSRHGQALIAIAPKLRAKQSPAVIDQLLSSAYLLRSKPIARMSPRAMGRLLDRLSDAGCIQEVSQRPVFRLYGL